MDLMSRLAQISDLTSETQIKMAFDTIIEFADLLGVPDSLIAKIKTALEDGDEFKLVASVFKYLLGHGDDGGLSAALDCEEGFSSSEDVELQLSAGNTVVVPRQGIMQWLAIAAQIIAFISKIVPVIPANTTISVED